MLVLDSSGSMASPSYAATYNGTTLTQNRQMWQRLLATDLVNRLPTTGVRVGVVQFDSSASTVRVLSDLSTDLAAVITAINSVDASGGTDIPSGQIQAFSVLTAGGKLNDPSTIAAMVVFSDGSTSGNPGTTADGHATQGVDLISSVALPGASVLTMQGIVDGVDNILGNADDHGAFINGTASMQTLVDQFTAGGSLVGIDHVDVTLPNGTQLNNVALDPLGGFTVPQSYNLLAGSNTWTATAYATDRSVATASLTLVAQANGVPMPGVVGLLAAGMLGFGAARRKRVIR
ncbi:vWA domain-containing protein [Thiocystis violascens]|uniref:vWA domain-containing protein n=1 Tax=Thiocystis violascens TaxID=73141 RepID=UPI0012F6E93A|nr:vWA domain-containing protein [Thiocystis violascens]